MSELLKPCPFCGADEAVGVSQLKTGTQIAFAVHCDQCGAGVEGRFWERSEAPDLPGFLKRAEAVEAWNARAPLPSQGTREPEPSAAEGASHCEAGDNRNEPSAREAASHREAGDK